MHYIKIVFQIIFLTSNSFVFGQNELQVGVKAPSIEYQSSFPSNYIIPGNKTIVLDFWATWCGPCVGGLLESNEFIAKYKNKIDYVAITDKTSSNVASFIKAKKLSQYFIIDNDAKTKAKFGVDGIPHAFLIDKNKIIQWEGQAQQLTPELLDEFLKSGSIKQKKEATLIAEVKPINNLPKHEFKLSITEQKIKNLEYGLNTRFQKDTFEYVANYNTIADAIASLYNNQTKRIIYKNIQPEFLNKRIAIEYNAINVDVEKTKHYLISSIGNTYQFHAKEQNIDTATWEVSIVDTVKLNRYKTVMTNKSESLGGGKYESNKHSEGYFTCFNYTTTELAEKLEREYDILCESKSAEVFGYDFEKMFRKDFKLLRTELFDKYGLLLSSKSETLKFLVIEGQ